MSLTGWKYDLVDRLGVRRSGTLVGDDLETKEKVRVYLKHHYGSGADDARLIKSGPDDEDTPEWRQKEIDLALPECLRRESDCVNTK